MTIRPPKYHSQGFTLLEMLAVMGMITIIMGFAIPSFLSLNKPLRDGVSEFKSTLSLVRSKAIASNKSYRIRPMYKNRSDYQDPGHEGIPGKFIVEYANYCRMTEVGGTNGWQRAAQFDLELPKYIGITDIPSTNLATSTGTATVNNNLDWSICFDNRGISDAAYQFIIKDFQGNNKAQIALFDLSPIGGIDIYTYNRQRVKVVGSDNKSPSF